MEEQIKQSVKDFLQNCGMSAENIDLMGETEKFIAEMEQGLAGAGGSLKMIPTYINASCEIPVGEPVIAIDAGGTNFRVAVVTFDGNKKPSLEGFQKFPMPGTQGKLGREEFFRTIADYLSPLLGKAKKIGFCFSYPTEILPNGDGRLIRFCKEIQVDGVEGELVGQGLLDAIAAAGGDMGKSIVLLNDTVATLLGGKAERANRQYGSYIGFILGTGTNTCYIEKIGNITKLDGLHPDGAMIVNIESGAYDKAPRGLVDVEFDAETTNPGEHAFEKMISGGYFGELALATFKRAAAEGLLSAACGKELAAIGEFATKDVNEYLDDPHGSGALARCCAGDADREALYYLVDGLYERAAKFVAANLSAVVKKSGAGRSPCMPVCVTADGTMFNKSKMFRSKLEHYVKVHMNEAMGLYAEFIEVENATLLGTAIAGLTGCV